MEKKQKESLWSDIKAISETQAGRQAMMTTGSVIAAAYMGYVGPDLLATMHDALVFYAAKYPLMDPQTMSSSLWGGAQHYSAAALDYMGDISSRFSLDLSHTIRESIHTARDFLSRGSERGLEAARMSFDQTTQYVSGYSTGTLQNIGTMLHSGYNAVKEHWGAVVAVGAAIKEAYDFYTTGESIFKRIFKRGKKEAEVETKVEANISVNVALCGTKALEKADIALDAQNNQGDVNVQMDRIIWLSEQMRGEIAARALEMDDDIPGEMSVGDRRAKVRAEVDRLLQSPEFNTPDAPLRQISLADVKNANKLKTRWDESPVSTGRFQSLKGQTRKTSHMEFDLADPLAFVKGSQSEKKIGREHDDFFVAANDNNFYSPTDDGPGLM
ncbi:hypothetical protein LCGC14_0042930 [marine sediment metagenome]|uniref:Uncharacterized protein n=2 Tax=root TaxID=1 RepID=A0A7V1FNY8_9RHOB|nr:hypothetical protein [Sulfitobacter litoralis]HDZ53356.1 hypothetical protein [Sulfitobacter litoralis]